MDRYIILGTAGHIDHGKSALVRTLTGTDPDRLKEEKERGITIDLGFAELTYPEGLKVGIVDVPGHERLIKNMLAGAGGIDIVLMVIAADEGIMPQSREHLDICNLLKVKRGLIAITKSDLVEKDWIELVRDDIANFVKGTFLEGSEIIHVSSKTGENIDFLKEKIRELALKVEPKSVNGIFRLPVDRVFTLRGFGTVVTGTALSGRISVDNTVVVLPRGFKTKVRGLQSHGQQLTKAYAGQRVAMNLQGIAKEEITRGDVITEPEKIRPSTIIDAALEILSDSSIQALKSRSLVHFHTGTSEMTCRIIIYGRDELKPGDKAYCQFRFSSPITVMAGDRYIIRRFSPLLTIGGGEILDPSPARRRHDEKLSALEQYHNGSIDDKLSLKILLSKVKGISAPELEGWINIDKSEINKSVESLIKSGTIIRCEGRLFHRDIFKEFSAKVSTMVSNFHKQNPLKPGISKEVLKSSFKGMDQKSFEGMLGMLRDIVIEKEIIRLRSFRISLSEDKKALKERILRELEKADFQPPSREELAGIMSVKNEEVAALLRIMASENTLVRINDSLYLPASNYSRMMKRIQDFFNGKNEMTVGEFRDVLKTSRKYAIPFLEYLDSNKITLRVGEVRKLLKKS